LIGYPLFRSTNLIKINTEGRKNTGTSKVFLYSSQTVITLIKNINIIIPVTNNNAYIIHSNDTLLTKNERYSKIIVP